jgi:hypothetical protein
MRTGFFIVSTRSQRTGSRRGFRDLPLDSSRERVRCIRCRCRSTWSTAYGRATMTRIASFVIAVTALSLSACTNPYDPVQRGLGGGVLGAASGAAIGAAAGGGPGAALGAAIGGATGIFGGVASTPPSPPGTYFGYPAYGPPAYGYPAYGYPGYPQPGYGYPGYSGYPAYSSPPGYAYPGYSGQPAYPRAPGYGYQSPPPYSPYSGSGYGNPIAGYPGDR